MVTVINGTKEKHFDPKPGDVYIITATEGSGRYASNYTSVYVAEDAKEAEEYLNKEVVDNKRYGLKLDIELEGNLYTEDFISRLESGKLDKRLIKRIPTFVKMIDEYTSNSSSGDSNSKEPPLIILPDDFDAGSEMTKDQLAKFAIVGDAILVEKYKQGRDSQEQFGGRLFFIKNDVSRKVDRILQYIEEVEQSTSPKVTCKIRFLGNAMSEDFVKIVNDPSSPQYYQLIKDEVNEFGK